MRLRFRLLLRRMFPFIRPAYTKWRLARDRKHYAALSVEEAFTRIYATQKWADDPTVRGYCSGAGSTPEFGGAYARVVNAIIAERGVKRVVDLGCGDFTVGRLLEIGPGVEYLGLDVVAGLVEHNGKTFGRPGLSFRHANIIDDELPDADLCLIRQVLQHLSNEQVTRVLAKCAKYPLLIVTEDVYSGADLRPNLDKPHGPDIRMYDKSGLFIELPPFNVPGRLILEMAATSTSNLRTLLVEGRNGETV